MRDGMCDDLRDGLRDGIQWLIDLHFWDSSIIFARGMGPDELAARMGGDTPPAERRLINDLEAWDAVFDGQYRPGEDGDGLIRVGRNGDWSFALEYGDSTGRDRLLDVSRDGAEAVRLDPMPEHPPKVFNYARGGQLICSFGIGEEHWRWGTEPDLLLTELIEQSVLLPGGHDRARQNDEHYKDRDRRTF
ncbi:hypothetical protein HCK01_10885, partial [Streptomyces sp. AA8]